MSNVNEVVRGLAELRLGLNQSHTSTDIVLNYFKEINC
jgi:hypothetical protein